MKPTIQFLDTTDRYAFGANQLHIMTALLKVLDYLREKHGFDPSK